VPQVLEAGALRLVGAEELEDIGLVVRTEGGDGGHEEGQMVRKALVELVGASRAPRRVLCTPDPLPRISQGKLDRSTLLDIWNDTVGGRS
jgi:hypothetical protein